MPFALEEPNIAFFKGLSFEVSDFGLFCTLNDARVVCSPVSFATTVQPFDIALVVMPKNRLTSFARISIFQRTVPLFCTGGNSESVFCVKRKR